MKILIYKKLKNHYFKLWGIIIVFYLFITINATYAQMNFPSEILDSITAKAMMNLRKEDKPTLNNFSQQNLEGSPAEALRMREKLNHLDIGSIITNASKSSDTLFIGLTPGDSLYISGNYTHNGPIIVWGDGILVFENANALIYGDLIVWGENAKVIISNSILNFPQAFLYQRSMLAAGNARIHIESSTLDYSGMSHNLVINDSAQVNWTNVTNIGFTTCGMWSKAEMNINGTNQAGEYIMTYKTSAHFTNAHTILIWHHIPDSSVFNTSFPDGTNMTSYQFNSSLPGIQNIDYSYTILNSSDVMWGLMPEPGSTCEISNSEIRAIGIWLKNQPDFQVSGLVNNSFYSNFTAPLNGHNISLLNTHVRTWNLYMFENALGNVDNCIVGEIGCFENSSTEVSNSLIDGSGGYLFSETNSMVINGFSYLNCDFQSKDNSFAFLVYGGQNWGRAIAMDKSIMFIIQSNISDLPELYNDAMVWYLKIESPSTLYTNSYNSISGSAWMNKASNFYPIDFGWYSLEYCHADSANWHPICGPVFNEVYSDELCVWHTAGITPGAYMLRLNMCDNSTDSNKVEALKLFNLVLPSGTSEIIPNENNLQIFPNPVNSTFTIKSGNNFIKEVYIFNALGKQIFFEKLPDNTLEKCYLIKNMPGLSQGVFYVKYVDQNDFSETQKIIFLE
ncbi:MAG: T9SS type A sorting domain-containing protein [Bacteroidales bacterium]|nr:T9SS type A sorting domain-containing protein [Bacteroidales bacterium]